VRETLLQIALLVAILGVSAFLTHVFARAMYITCFQCGTVNARRRACCGHCGEQLRKG